MRRTDWRLVAYMVVLLALLGALVWGIANCNSGC